ncbi:MAG TPA: hypothetical protein VKS60_18145 [Stellaceae bacterium]|nr:hypothetical protein [Stellaceae bacterium]
MAAASMTCAPVQAVEKWIDCTFTGRQHVKVDGKDASGRPKVSRESLPLDGNDNVKEKIIVFDDERGEVFLYDAANRMLIDVEPAQVTTSHIYIGDKEGECTSDLFYTEINRYTGAILEKDIVCNAPEASDKVGTCEVTTARDVIRPKF